MSNEVPIPRIVKAARSKVAWTVLALAFLLAVGGAGVLHGAGREESSWWLLFGCGCVSVLLFLLVVVLVWWRDRELPATWTRLEEIQDASERLREAVRSGGVGTWDYDVVRGDLAWDEQMFRLYGLEQERSSRSALEVWRNRLHPEERDRCDREIQMALEGEKTFDTEFRIVLPDGGVRHIRAFGIVRRDGQGHPLHMVGTNWDITEQKLSEEARRRSAQRESQLLQTTDQGIYGIDASGACTFINRSGLRFLGYELEECLGRNMHDLIHHSRKDGTAYPQEECPIFKARHGGHHGRVESEVFWRKDGTSFPVEYSSFPVVEDGEVTGAVITFTDVSERLEAQAALVRANQELQEAIQRAQELASQAEHASRAKSEFLANMSHEIRTPMNGVIGMTRILLGTGLNAEQRRYAEVIRGSGETLLALIDEILDVSKIEAGKLLLESIEFAPRPLVEDLMAILAPRVHAKGLEFVCAIDHGMPPMVMGDPGRLRQILMNLVGNAIKFTKQGRIVVRVEVQSRTDEDATIQFRVQDTGIGIPEEKQAALFQKFVQVDASTTRQYGGTGLGLAISRELAEMMGGRIGVRSREGLGSEFWFTVRLRTLPVSEFDPVSVFPVEQAGERVLVVDDDSVAAEVLCRQLWEWGMRVDGASGAQAGLAALDAALAEDEPFAFAIVDARMPGIDGVALAKSVKEEKRFAGTRVVLLTSFSEADDVLRAESLPDVARIAKPVRASELHDALAASGEDVPPWSGSSEEPSSDAGSVRASHVLLVEDNEVNQMVATALLEQMGARCEVVDNGRAAIVALENDDFDLVFMDVHMPTMDGLEATRRIRAEGARVRDRAIPVIAMTADAMQGDREVFLAAGMDDYVSKPVSPERMREILDRWLPRGGGEGPVKHRCHRREIPEDAVLDWQGLLERVLDKESVALRVADVFRKEIPQRAEELPKLLEAGDLRGVSELAHLLKGAAGNLGAPRLRAMARSLEANALEGDAGCVERYVRDTLDELALVIAALERRLAAG